MIVGQPAKRCLRKQLGQQRAHRLIERSAGSTLGAVDQQHSSELKVPPQVGQLIVARLGKRAIASQVQKRMPVQRRDIAQMDDLGNPSSLRRTFAFPVPTKAGTGLGPRDRLRRRQPGQLNLSKLAACPRRQNQGEPRPGDKTRQKQQKQSPSCERKRTSDGLFITDRKPAVTARALQNNKRG